MSRGPSKSAYFLPPSGAPVKTGGDARTYVPDGGYDLMLCVGSTHVHLRPSVEHTDLVVRLREVDAAAGR